MYGPNDPERSTVVGKFISVKEWELSIVDKRTKESAPSPSITVTDAQENPGRRTSPKLCLNVERALLLEPQDLYVM